METRKTVQSVLLGLKTTAKYLENTAIETLNIPIRIPKDSAKEIREFFTEFSSDGAWCECLSLVLETHVDSTYGVQTANPVYALNALNRRITAIIADMTKEPGKALEYAAKLVELEGKKAGLQKSADEYLLEQKRKREKEESKISVLKALGVATREELKEKNTILHDQLYADDIAQEEKERKEQEEKEKKEQEEKEKKDKK